MRSLVLVICALCIYSNAASTPTDENVLVPLLSLKDSSKALEEIAPFLESLSAASTFDQSMMNNATYVAYRKSQAKSIHLVLDTIVRSVENNLAEVDAYYGAMKDNFRKIKAAEFKRLEDDTSDGVKEDKRLDDLVESTEGKKIKQDKAYGSAQGELEAQRLAVQKIRHDELTQKLKADSRFVKDIQPINKAHNESREMYVNELMFIAKIRQMVEKMNSDYVHAKGSTAHPTPSTTLGTHAPTHPPTPAPTFGDLNGKRFATPNPTASPTPAPTSFLASCAKIQESNPAIKSGLQNIQTSTGKIVQAYCDFDTDNGAYTIIKCDDISPGGCKETSGADGKDTCAAVGLQMLVPRSKNHWSSLVKNLGDQYLTIIPGISKATAGKGPRSCIMRSVKGHADGCPLWRAVGGGSYWVRDQHFPEPSKDYKANQWLCLDPVTDVNYITFNDNGCKTTKYPCSTNDYDPA